MVFVFIIYKKMGYSAISWPRSLRRPAELYLGEEVAICGASDWLEIPSFSNVNPAFLMTECYL